MYFNDIGNLSGLTLVTRMELVTNSCDNIALSAKKSATFTQKVLVIQKCCSTLE